MKTFRWKKFPEEKPGEFHIVILWPHMVKAEYQEGHFLSLKGGSVYINVEWWIESRALPSPLSSPVFKVDTDPK